MQLLWHESRKSPKPVKWGLENTKMPRAGGGLCWGQAAHTHTHAHMDKPVASAVTGTLILSQSNNAAAGTNRELFNSHQLMLCHQVLLCAFPILILCISRISFAFIFIAQMLENRRGWGGEGCCHKSWYLRPAPEMGQRERCDIVLSHSSKDRYLRCLFPSLCLYTSMFSGLHVHLHVLFVFMVVCMYTQMQTLLGVYICMIVCFPVCLSICVGCKHQK